MRKLGDEYQKDLLHQDNNYIIKPEFNIYEGGAIHFFSMFYYINVL